MSHPPKLDDFVWMYQGKQLHSPRIDELLLVLTKEEEKHSQKKTALLMLHGFSSSPAVFRLLAPQINKYDCIYMPQLAGHGTNLFDFEESTAQKWLGTASEAYQHLAKSYDNVDVLGLSLGGLIACHLAHQFPICHLYLMAPALGLVSSISVLLRFSKICHKLGFKFVRNFGGRVFASQEEELLYRLLPIPTVIEILNFIQDYQHKGWTHPTTLFLGAHDNVVNSTSVINKLTNCLNMEIVLLENSGHVLPLDNDLQQIIQRINQMK